MIVSRIQPKLKKDYGPNTALVIRDTSPLDWDWALVADQIKRNLILGENPFDKRHLDYFLFKRQNLQTYLTKGDNQSSEWDAA